MAARITNSNRLALAGLAGSLAAGLAFLAMGISMEHTGDPFTDRQGPHPDTDGNGDGNNAPLQGTSGRPATALPIDPVPGAGRMARTIERREQRRTDGGDGEAMDHDPTIAGLAERLMGGSLPPGPLLQYLAHSLETAAWGDRRPRLEDDGSLDSFRTAVVYGSGTTRYRLLAELVHHDRRLVEGRLRLAIPAALVGRRIGIPAGDEHRVQAALRLQLRLRPPSEARDVPLRAEVRIDATSTDENVRRRLATATARSGLGPLVRIWCHHEAATYAHVLPVDIDRHGRLRPATREATRTDTSMSAQERQDLRRVVTGIEQLMRAGDPDQPR